MESCALNKETDALVKEELFIVSVTYPLTVPDVCACKVFDKKRTQHNARIVCLINWFWFFEKEAL